MTDSRNRKCFIIPNRDTVVSHHSNSVAVNVKMYFEYRIDSECHGLCGLKMCVICKSFAMKLSNQTFSL